MGIEASYRRLTPKEFERLHNDAAYASVYFGYDLETDEAVYAYFDALEASDRYVDLDKHWQTLHFLFTGNFPYDSANKSNTLLHRVFMGGTATPWEATYGMVRYLSVSEVNEMAEALNHISEEDLKSRFDNLRASAREQSLHGATSERSTYSVSQVIQSSSTRRRSGTFVF